MSAPFTTSRAMAMTLALQSMDHHPHHRDKSTRRHLLRRTRQAGRSGD